MPKANNYNKAITHFVFELGVLKKFRHCGIKYAGINNPDSIAEHVFRTAQIGYILGRMEKNKHPKKIALMCLIHDNAEARIGDHHKIALNYLNKQDIEQAEEKAYYDQVKKLPEEIGTNLWDMYEEFMKQETDESKIAKDADYLELAFQCKEYKDMGTEAAQSWLDNIENALCTNSAKELFKSLTHTKFTEWWKKLH